MINQPLTATRQACLSFQTGLSQSSAAVKNQEQLLLVAGTEADIAIFC
jgi:hypothetical protein